MKQAENPEEVGCNANLARHQIMTNLHFCKEWDPEAWILFHQLLIFTSMRGKCETGQYVQKIFSSYSTRVIKIIEEKKKTGAEIIRDPTDTLNDYFKLATSLFHIDPDDESISTKRINDALRENRDSLIAKTDSPFGHILTQSDLEIKTSYKEYRQHDNAEIVLSYLQDSLSTEAEIKNFQFEVSKNVTDRDVQKILFEYFLNKGFTTEEFVLCTGSVHDEKGKLFCATSVSVEEGYNNSVALITLSYYH